MARYRSPTGTKPKVRRNFRSRASVVLSELTHGAYNREGMQNTSAATSTTIGTEIELGSWASQFKGDNTNKITKVFPWIRGNFCFFTGTTAAAGHPLELFIMKSKQSDSIEDMSDPDVCERKMRAGEVFHHSVRMIEMYGAKPFRVEFKNVRLLPDEELRAVVLPWYTQASSWYLEYFNEWREPQYG